MALTSTYAIPGYQPSYEMEIRGAVEYLNNHVLPPEKPVELYQWSGDCNPPAGAFAILEEMGLENINGGDPLYDTRFNSLYYICPLSVPKGASRQVYTSACNENIYTENWTGFRGAFSNVISTFEKSESPIRLLPVNIYYHVFPAESLAGGKAIVNVYKWAAKQDLCWITALEYVRAVNDFMKARIGRTEDGGWWAEDYGACQTIRFDGEGRSVDMAGSANVAGFAWHNDSLYVSLLPGKRAEIRLTERHSDMPSLARASGLVRNVESGTDYWRAECRSWSRGFVELRASDEGWRATATIPGGKETAGEPRRLDDGCLRFEFPGGAGKWVDVVFEK
jgi:hypothetical protein